MISSNRGNPSGSMFRYPLRSFLEWNGWAPAKWKNINREPIDYNCFNLFPSNYPRNISFPFSFFCFKRFNSSSSTDSDTFEHEMQMGWGLATFLTLCELGSTLSFIYAREWRASGQMRVSKVRRITFQVSFLLELFSNRKYSIPENSKKNFFKKKFKSSKTWIESKWIQ